MFCVSSSSGSTELSGSYPGLLSGAGGGITDCILQTVVGCHLHKGETKDQSRSMEREYSTASFNSLLKILTVVPLHYALSNILITVNETGITTPEAF